jgi:hypothetical protein
LLPKEKAQAKAEGGEATFEEQKQCFARLFMRSKRLPMNIKKCGLADKKRIAKVLLIARRLL